VLDDLGGVAAAAQALDLSHRPRLDRIGLSIDACEPVIEPCAKPLLKATVRGACKPKRCHQRNGASGRRKDAVLPGSLATWGARPHPQDVDQAGLTVLGKGDKHHAGTELSVATTDPPSPQQQQPVALY